MQMSPVAAANHVLSACSFAFVFLVIDDVNISIILHYSFEDFTCAIG